MGTTNAQSGREQSAPAVLAVAAAALPLVPRERTTAATATHVAGNGIPITLDFAAEYQKAYRVLWVVAAGVLGRSAGAEDVLQEAALLALKKVDQFQPGTHFVAWMA